MLGKQVWQMLKQPNLLVSRILKAKYFPKESILKCKVPKNSSWFWQSIMAVRDIVKEGTLKKVGTWKSISI